MSGVWVYGGFIQDPEHRPKIDYVEAEGIPVIDLCILSSPESDPAAFDRLLKEIADACEEWGFFQIINHGVPQQVRQNLDSATRKFFHMPLDQKVKVKRDEVRVLGYYDSNTTKNVRDWREVFDFGVIDPTLAAASHLPEDNSSTLWPSQWPDESLPEFRLAGEEYAKEMVKIAYKLMELISLTLGLPGDRFHSYFKDQISHIRLNYYKPCPVPDLILGAGRHKDGPALTVLAQDDTGGLEIKRKSGEWVRVRPVPDAYIINVGDVVQVWSNEKYVSVEHRAAGNPAKERFSMAFFFSPSHYEHIEPAEELVNEQNPPKYRPYNYGKFLTSRKRSNFQKLPVENIQIAHFRIPESELVKKN